MRKITHGALFSGSGGFGLAARNAGIDTLWASEIEPFPILVTRKNFPGMEHLGDISRIDGGSVEPVDVVSGGSPCQDMSVAGKREGLDGSRSNLFHEYVRVVKEMRRRYEDKPRYMVWENVPGAFSSNKGEDFRCVLQEICNIASEGDDVPRPPKGKWQTSGCIMGDGYSVAWRVLDAQYWGVPQRRKRIYLVADFGGDTAPEILFESPSLRRDPPQGAAPRQGTAGSTEDGAHGTGRGGQLIRNRRQAGRFELDGSGVSETLEAAMGMGGNNGPLVLDSHPHDGRVGFSGDGNIQTLSGQMGTGGNNTPLLMEPRDGSRTAAPIANKATRYKGGGETRKDDGAGNGLGIGEPGDPSYTLTAGDRHGVAYGIDRAAFNQGVNAKYDFAVEEELQPTMTARGPAAVGTYAMQGFGDYKESDKASSLKTRDYKDSTDPIAGGAGKYVIRRLTPLECCRLQGFPDGWTEDLAAENPSAAELKFWTRVWAEHWALVDRADGVKSPKDEKAVRRWLKNPASDSALYKMWGNGLALPCARMVMDGIAAAMEKEDERE